MSLHWPSSASTEVWEREVRGWGEGGREAFPGEGRIGGLEVDGGQVLDSNPVPSLPGQSLALWICATS